MTKSVIQCLRDIAYKLGLIADYVVETGTDGIWTYRKWASGIAECWGGGSLTNGTYATTWNGMQAISVSIPLPFAIKNGVMQLGLKAGSGYGWNALPLAWSDFILSATTQTLGSQSSASISYSAYVVGLWKELGGVVRHLIWRWSYA